MTIIKFFLFAALLITKSCSDLTQPDEKIKLNIAGWLNDAEVAVSFTFDDNSATHEKTGNILKEHGFKGSFYVNPGYSTWHDLQDIYYELVQTGHEVANHSWTHKKLTTLEMEELRYEVNHPVDVLKRDLGVVPLSFVHPFNITNAAVDEVVFEKHLFSRISSLHSMSERKILNLHQGTPISRYERKLKSSLHNNNWFIIAAHNLNTEGDTGLTITPGFLHSMCNYIRYKQKEHKIWVGTLSEVAHYEYLRNEIIINRDLKGKEMTISFSGYNQDKYQHVDRSKLTFIVKNPPPHSELSTNHHLDIQYVKDNLLLTLDLQSSTEYIITFLS